LQSTADTINANTSGLSAQITPIGANLTALQTTVNGHTTQLTNLQTSMKAITSTSDLAAQIANLTSKVTQIYDNLYPPPVLELKFNQNTFTDLLGTDAAGADDYVRSWRSMVGGHLLTQSTDAARPQRQSDGIYFDGEDYLNSTTFLNNGDFTIGLWYATSLSMFYCGLIGTYNGTTNSFSVAFSGNTVSFHRHYIGDIVSYNNASIINGSHHHVAISRKFSVVYLFFDGVLVNSGNDSTEYSASAIVLGRSGTQTGYNYTGKLTDIQIYNTAKYTVNFTPPARSV